MFLPFLLFYIYSLFISQQALTDKTAVTVATELVNIFSLMGYPKIVSHDCGKEFFSILLQKIIEKSGMEERLSLPFNPLGNSTNEAFVGKTKRVIIKMLKGKEDSWDLYVGSTQLFLNLSYARLHGSKPFHVMFHRQANELMDYTNLEPVLPQKEIDSEAIKEKLAQIDNIIIPAIKEQIVKRQKADNDYFKKKHRILEKPFPIGSEVMVKDVENKHPKKTDCKYVGPFYVHGYTKNGSYILQDRTKAFLTRDIPTSHIKLINDDNVVDNPENDNHYTVQAIVDHRGVEPNYEYRVRWKGYTVVGKTVP